MAQGRPGALVPRANSHPHRTCWGGGGRGRARFIVRKLAVDGRRSSQSEHTAQPSRFPLWAPFSSPGPPLWSRLLTQRIRSLLSRYSLPTAALSI